MKRILRRLIARFRFEQDMHAELRDHLDRRTADLIASGLAPTEAARRAQQEFGALESYKEQIRAGRGGAALMNLPDQLGRETRFALRRLLAAPGFSLFAIASLAVGIGVTTAVYSVLYPVMWPASGLRGAGQLVYLTTSRTEVSRNRSWQYTTARGDFNELAAAEQTMAAMAAWTVFAQPFVDGAVRAPVSGEAVTGLAFEIAGTRAALGRMLVQTDDAPEAASVVVLNHTFWKHRLGADPHVIGRVVRIGGQPVEIVGVAEATFKGFGRPMLVGGPAMWMPLAAAARLPMMRRSAIDPANHDGMALSVIARLKQGRSAEEVSAEVAAIGRRLDRAYPIPLSTRFWKPQPDEHGGAPREWQAARVDRAIAAHDPFGWLTGFLLVGLVGLVLAVACTNLANLTIARGSARLQELATRRALGSSRWRLVREQALESAVLAIAGGGLGLALAKSILVAVVSAVPTGLDVGLETDLLPGVVLASGGLVLVTLFVFGLWPAMQLSRADLRSSLTGDAGTSGAVRWRVRRHFISAQVAVSAAFFLVAAMFVKTIVAHVDLNPGVDVDRVALTGVNFRLHQWDEARSRAALDRIVRSARDEKFEAVAVSAGLPYGILGDQAGIASPEKPFTADGQDDEWASVVSASPQIFRVLGVPIVRGRAFDERDSVGAPPVAVLSEQTARTLFKTTDVVGRRLLTRDDLWQSAQTSGPARPATTVRALEVIGVARDTDVGAAGRRDRNLVYLPYAQHYDPVVSLVVRTPGDARAAAAMLPALIHRTDPDLVTGLSGDAATLLDGRAAMMRMMAGIGLSLGAIVLVLAMTGLFGVLSHLVARRIRELGLRMALGATSGDLARLVLRDGLRPVVVGLVIGTGLGVLGRLIFRATVTARGFDAIDPVAMVIVPVALAMAGVVACYLPARRASRVDPNVALRNL